VCGLDSFGIGQGSLTGFCKDDTEPLGSIGGGIALLG
jgi:hypothetical protein